MRVMQPGAQRPAVQSTSAALSAGVIRWFTRGSDPKVWMKSLSVHMWAVAVPLSPEGR